MSKASKTISRLPGSSKAGEGKVSALWRRHQEIRERHGQLPDTAQGDDRRTLLAIRWDEIERKIASTPAATMQDIIAKLDLVEWETEAKEDAANRYGAFLLKLLEGIKADLARLTARAA